MTPALAFSWWFRWPPRVIPRPRVQYRSLRAAADRFPPMPAWWLARRALDRDVMVTWRDSWWWFMARIDLREARYRLYFWLGIITGPEGGFYHEHRWCWPWEDPAAGWRRTRANLRSRWIRARYRIWETGRWIRTSLRARQLRRWSRQRGK